MNVPVGVTDFISIAQGSGHTQGVARELVTRKTRAAPCPLAVLLFSPPIGTRCQSTQERAWAWSQFKSKLARLPWLMLCPSLAGPQCFHLQDGECTVIAVSSLRLQRTGRLSVKNRASFSMLG